MPRGHFCLPYIGLSCSCRARQAPRVNWVLDIGEALDTLGGILKRYNFQNLDELFPGENTTTEFMCKVGGCGQCGCRRVSCCNGGARVARYGVGRSSAARAGGSLCGAVKMEDFMFVCGCR